MISRSLILAVVMGCSAWINAAVINVKDFGAKGDNKTDDTISIQKAIDKAIKLNKGGVLYFPAGRYLVSETLKINKAMGLIVRGEGALGYKAGTTTGTTTQSVLVWNGENDGVLLHTIGCFSNRYENMAFSGRKNGADKTKRAGILFLVTTLREAGNMIHRFSNLSFTSARVGIQVGSKDTRKTNDSDFFLDSIYFGSLDSGFLATHEQAVDYTFSFVFGLNCGTVFDFRKGGNLLVNTAQLTSCHKVLYIERCGANNGLFLLNNTRLESSSQFARQGKRGQLLSTGKNVGIAIIRFNNYCDAQWMWHSQKPQPDTPLCEVNSGVFVEFNNSVFQGPVAVVEGSKKQKARLRISNSLFRYISPDKAIKTNQYGFYKLTDNFGATLNIFTDNHKWHSSVSRP